MAKMKSLCGSGRKNSFCMLFPRPQPDPAPRVPGRKTTGPTGTSPWRRPVPDPPAPSAGCDRGRDSTSARAASETATAAVPSRWPMRARPTKKIIVAVMRRTTAVPKLGCTMIKAGHHPRHQERRQKPVQEAVQSVLPAGEVARQEQDHGQFGHLRGLEGQDPSNRSQRRAPLIFTPTPGTSTRSRRSRLARNRMGVRPLKSS